MKDVKLVIFDMDGLLFDTERLYYSAMKQVMEKKWGCDFPLENYKRFIGVDERECDDVMKSLYGKDFSMELILEDYYQLFSQILREEGLQVKKGAKDILDFLDKKGIKKCIAYSSRPRYDSN